MSRSSSSVRHAVIGAYQSLGEGDAKPLVALLSPDVEWIEWDAWRPPRTGNGRNTVAALIEDRAERAGAAPVRAIAVGRNALVMHFRRPWWREHPQRIRELLARGFGRSFAQTVSFGSEIERIECFPVWRL